MVQPSACDSFHTVLAVQPEIALFPDQNGTMFSGSATEDTRNLSGLKKGDIIARMYGSTKTLLKGERTALNILQHMSGIATATNKCVKLVEGTNAHITDTRKTLPGLRRLQKYAVTVGGGKNHRYNLSDGAMLKEFLRDTDKKVFDASVAKEISKFFKFLIVRAYYNTRRICY